MSIRNIPFIFSLSLILTSLVLSCKKEYVDKFNVIPGDTVRVSGDNYVRSFTIKEYSADTAITATIKNDSIIVYWPSYKPLPSVIRPEIQLPEKTTILPANGEEVEFKTGTSYKVTSESGKIKNYKLVLDFRQPKPMLTRAAEGTVIARNTGAYYGNGTSTLISGDWIFPVISQTKAYFVAVSDKKEYEVEVTSVTTSGIKCVIPATIPEGNYDLKLVNGIHTQIQGNTWALSASTSTGIAFWYLPPYDLTKNRYVFPKANDLIIRGDNLDQIGDVFFIRNVSTGAWHQMEILDLEKQKVVLKVTEGTPLGDYDRIRYSSENKEARLRFTITE